MKTRGYQRITLSLAVLVAMTSGSPAAAHAKTFPTTNEVIGVSSPPLTFRGQVSSTKSGCFPNRRIVLTFGEEVVGEARTDSTGRYSVTSSTNESGEYVIEATKKAIRRGNGHRHVCAAATTSFTK